MAASFASAPELAEKHVFHAGRGAQLFCDSFLQANMKQIRGMNEATRLLGNCLGHARILVSQVRHRDA